MNRTDHKLSSLKLGRLKCGQVTTEYILILTLVVAVLATAKIKVTPSGQLDLSGGSDSKTIMESLSQAFTVWMQDMFIILSLPS